MQDTQALMLRISNAGKWGSPMATKMPTDRDLLDKIYQQNYHKFASINEADQARRSRTWIPIDLNAIANHFNSDPDLIFGRLYYHLNEKYAHTSSDGSKFEFFAIRVGGDPHCVNFPYLVSILASLKDEHRKFMLTTAIAGLSLIISILSMLVAITL